MRIKVTKDTVSVVKNDYTVNQGEYNVNACNFEFTDEYEGLVKKAVFNQGETDIEMVIIHDGCDIPAEFLNGNAIQLRVYAYEVNGDNLVLRYSPTPTNLYLRPGSYRGLTGSGEEITATQFEQYEQALHDGLAQVDNVDIDVEKVNHVATVTITNRNNTTKSVEIYDGEQGEQGEQGPQGPVGPQGPQGPKGDTGDCNFATFEINLTTGNLEMNKTEDMLLEFGIENSYLYVEI